MFSGWIVLAQGSSIYLVEQNIPVLSAPISTEVGTVLLVIQGIFESKEPFTYLTGRLLGTGVVTNNLKGTGRVESMRRALRLSMYATMKLIKS